MPKPNEFPQAAPSPYDTDFTELSNSEFMIPEPADSENFEKNEVENTPREVYRERGNMTNRVEISNKEMLKDRERFLELQKRQKEIAEKLKSLGITITEDPKFTAMSEEFLKSTEAKAVEEPEPEVEPEVVETEEAPEVTESAETTELAPVTPAEVATNAIKHKGFGKYISDFVKKHARGIIAGLAVTLGATGIGGAVLSAKYANAATGGGFLTEESANVNPGGTLEQSIDNALNNPGANPVIVVNTPEKAMPTAAAAVETKVENTDVSGETINGVRYDYSEYADRENKTSKNAYGYDYSNQFGDRAESTKGILHMASTEPEALASYAYELLTKSEKRALGIDGLTMVQIDNKFDGAGGGDLQKKLIDKLTQILEDEQNTDFKFYYENGTENTHYIYFTDDNGDGELTPDELHIGYDVKKRNNAPQVDIYRNIENANGTVTSQKMIDLNMYCGYQPNYVKAPVGVQRVQTTETAVENVVTPTVQTIVGGGTVTPTPTPTITGGGTVTPTPTPNPTITPTPTPEPDPTPTPTPPPPPPGPTPTPTPAPKDGENLSRIDDQIKSDIEDNIHTGELVITPTEDVTKVEEKTEKPTGDDYEGTAATTTESEASQAAEQVTGTSSENDASQDRGGANAGNAEEHPVEENDREQERANENEISQEEAPQTASEVRSELSDLGIE